MSDWWKTVGSSVSFIVHMRIAIKKLSEITQGAWAGFECELRTSKSGICLDQNFKIGWLCIEGKRWVGVRKLDFFVDVINESSLTNSFLLFNMIFFFCFSLSLHSLLFHSFFYCFCMLSKRDNHNFKKIRGRTNLKI